MMLKACVVRRVKRKDGKNLGPCAVESTCICQPLNVLHETNKPANFLWWGIFFLGPKHIPT